MTQRRLIVGSAMAAMFALGCGSSDTNSPTVPGVGTPADGGGIIGPDGQVIFPTDGGSSNNTLDGGAVVVPGGDSPYNEDHSNEAGLAPGMVDTLRNAAAAAGAAGGGAGGANNTPSNCTDLLYPYDGTTMPAALISPPFMFSTGWDAAYVRVGYQGSARVDYQFAVGASNPAEMRIPAEQWANIVARTTAGQALTFTFAFSRGGATATCVSRMKIANGNMTGAIYYNTYNSPQSSGVGAVLRLTLGQPQPESYLREPVASAPIGPCIGCHSVSADGSTLAASKHIYFPASFSAKSYPIAAGVQPAERADVKDAAFGGITPTGDAILRMGNPDCTQGANAFPRAKNNFPLAIGPTKAGLIDTVTGNEIPTNGLLDTNFYWMPQFSPDGRKVVFNNARLEPGNSTVQRRELAVADYDPGTHTFSAPRVLLNAGQLGAPAPTLDYTPKAIDLATFGSFFGGVTGTDNCSGNWGDDNAHVAASKGTSCTGPCYPAWPFFTPDGKGVIFSMVSEPDFAVAFPGREAASKSELWYADVATGKAVRLDNANKVPGGDGLNNYYPTVLPVQVGGYFWLFWTSTRPFGHRELSGGIDGAINDGIFGTSSSSAAFKKRIWVSAIIPQSTGEFQSDTLTDPSLPPFYLEGQGNTGNTRAFAALNPCKDRGAECKSGLDCCTGYCNIDPNTKVGHCGDKITCAQLNEKCAVSADCCPPATVNDPKTECIGGYCGFVVLR